MEVIEVESGIAVFLSEHPGNRHVLEFVIEDGPLIAESNHGFDAFLMLLLEQCGGGVLKRGVRCRCIVWTGCHLQFLLWE